VTHAGTAAVHHGARLGLQSLALADPELSVIREYDANKYGMMGDTLDSTDC